MFLKKNCVTKFCCLSQNWFLVFGLVLAGGCAPKGSSFVANELHVASLSGNSTESEVSESAETIRLVVDDLFGTPDVPKWPESVPPVVDMDRVTRAAGPVGRNENKVERGLYQKHCVQCHGITGDGMGPASALLAPYPRDFRRGSFKFKTTPIGKKPTHSDLIRTLENGLAGTAMPAFGTLNHSKEYAFDVDALAHYVRFLSIRGEVERRLIFAKVNEEMDESAVQIAARVAKNWADADSHAMKPANLSPPANAEEQLASIKRGKEIFLSELTACSKCHGKSGDGKGASQDFDEWTKDWTIRAGIDPANKAEWKTMKKFGARKPVIDSSRNLTLGAFRGGSSRDDIYNRIVLGIEGSPMPAIARKVNDNPGVTEEGIRDLVEYVFSLSNVKSQNAVHATVEGANHANTN